MPKCLLQLPETPEGGLLYLKAEVQAQIQEYIIRTMELTAIGV